MTRSTLKLAPVLVPYGKGKWILDKDFTYRGVTVKAGFVYNGASIPRFLWPTIGCPSNPLFMGASLIHDWLYTYKKHSRKRADIIFYWGLLENGVNEGRAVAMYRALRMFGGKAWRG